MSLTAISSLESARRKFFELDVHHVYKEGSNVFWAQAAEMSKSHPLARIDEKKIFHEHDVHHV